MKRQQKIIIIFTILAIVNAINVTFFYFNNLAIQMAKREKVAEVARNELHNANVELDQISIKIDGTTILLSNEFEILEKQTNEYLQDLKIAKMSLSEVQRLFIEAEKSEVVNMKPLYEEAIQKLNCMEILYDINVDEIKQEKNKLVVQAINIGKNTKVDLYNINKKLNDSKYRQHQYLTVINKGTELTHSSNKLYKATVEDAEEVETKIENIEFQAIKIGNEARNLEESLSEIFSIIEEYEKIEAVKQSLLEKINSMLISTNTDMSKTLNLTEEELKFLLQVTGFIKDEDIIDILPSVIVETVKEAPVNEICALAVMSLETGYFKSSLAVKKNNFGGMLDAKGKGMVFQTKEEGLEAAIKCIYKNLKGDNTIYDINSSYCTPFDLNGNGKIEGEGEIYYWSHKVISIMERYKKEVIENLSE